MKHFIPSALCFASIMSCAGFAATVQPSAHVVFVPTPSSLHISGCARLEVTYDPAPEILSKWAEHGVGEAVIARHRAEVIAALTRDLTDSGLFASVLSTPGDLKADFTLKAHCEIHNAASDHVVRVSLELFDASAGGVVASVEREATLGPGSGPGPSLEKALPDLMHLLREGLARQLEHRRLLEAELAEIANAHKAPLADLILVSSETNPIIARERNRALVAAKDEQLPGMLRDWKTDRLSALVVKGEQSVLDLNHECEVAKDKAQQNVAEGSVVSTAPDNPMAGSRLRSLQGQMGLPAQPAPVHPKGFLGITTAGGGAGALVKSIFANSPAAQAGLKAGDIIVSVDNQPVPTADALLSCLAQVSPGTSMHLVLKRSGTEQAVDVAMGPRLENTLSPTETLRDLSISYRERIELIKPVLAAIRGEIENRNR